MRGRGIKALQLKKICTYGSIEVSTRLKLLRRKGRNGVKKGKTLLRLPKYQARIKKMNI
jgi:hypothetical protein